MEGLKQQWERLATRHFRDANQVESIYQLLATHYQESHRYYHGFSHIQALLQKAEKLAVSWLKPDLVHVAIWFHDVIYDATRTDNEQKSADLAINVLRQNSTFAPDAIAYVAQLILATAKHELVADHDDVRHFLDLDLSILGEDWETYKSYASAIRKEYAQVPWERYQAGRKQVLVRFLERDQIYYSTLFGELYEENARRNIQREIEELLN